MTTFYLPSLQLKFLFFMLICLVARADAGIVGDPIPPDSTGKSPDLGHVMCVIHTNTNCLTQEVTLEAWLHWTFTGVKDPITVPWSTGEVAHKIVVEPPGTWSWDAAASGSGCELVHQFTTVTFDAPFFDGPLEIVGPQIYCPSEPSQLTVNANGYNAFGGFQWAPAYNSLSPYPISSPGNYSLTVSDAFGCTFTDQIEVSNVTVAGETCLGGCIECDLHGFQGTNDGPIAGGNTICGSIVVHNAKWVGFVAGTDSIALEVVPSNCQQGDGLQIAIFDDCSDKYALVCNAGCPGCGTTPLSLSFSDFVPGENYWLMVDGYVADVCDFTVNVLGGSTIAPLPSATDAPVGLNSICPGGTAVYTVPAAAGAGFYHWTAPPGASINGGSNSLNVSAPQGISVSIAFGTMGGQVCVQAGNSCQPMSASACTDVAIQPLMETNLPTTRICFEALPYTWNEAPYSTLTGPGTYMLSSDPYDSYLGCDSVVRQTIIVNSPIMVNLAPKFICKGECVEIAGEFFCETGPQVTVLPSFDGCDSLISFSIVVLDPVAEIVGPTELTCDQTSLTLQSALSPGTKSWYDGTGQLLAVATSLVINEPGLYVLKTVLTAGGVSCENYDSIQVIENLHIADVQVLGTQNGCLQDPLVLTGSTSVTDGQFQWSGPNGFMSNQQSPTVVLPGAYSVTVTTANGCSGVATAEVQTLGGMPNVSAASDTITCANTIGQLDGGSTMAGASFSWTGPNGFESMLEDPAATTPGEYTLTVTGPYGCTNTAVVFLDDNLHAPLVLVADATIICMTYPYLVANTTATSALYQWAGPNGFTSNLPQPQVLEAGTYTVTVIDQTNGCSSADEAVVTLETTVLQIVPTTIVRPDAGQSNGSIDVEVLSNSMTLTYSWTYNAAPFAQTQDISNLAAGVYQLLVTDENGCTSQQTFELMPVSGVQQPDSPCYWTISPNPSSGRFEISCGSDEHFTEQVMVYDLNSRLILEQNVSGTQKAVVIDLEGMPTGLYLLEVRNAQASTWRKLVVQR